MTWGAGWRVAVGIAVLGLAAQGCGVLPDRDRRPEPTPTPTATGQATAAPTGTGGPQPTDDGFAWVPFGPADQNSPDGRFWYRSLEEANCERTRIAGEGLGGGDPLVLALAAVCEAAINNDQSQWALAQQYSQQQRRVQNPTCLENAGEALLARALAWHASHPGQKPVVSLPAAGGPVACKFEITEVVAVNESGQPIGPAQGPITGNTLVRITGDGLSEAKAVFFGAHEGKIKQPYISNNQTVYAYTPEGDYAGAVDVKVRNRAGDAVLRGAFTYYRFAPGPSTSGSPRNPRPRTS